MNGKGIDRHLFTLYVASRGLGYVSVCVCVLIFIHHTHYCSLSTGVVSKAQIIISSFCMLQVVNLDMNHKFKYVCVCVFSLFYIYIYNHFELQDINDQSIDHYLYFYFFSLFLFLPYFILSHNFVLLSHSLFNGSLALLNNQRRVEYPQHFHHHC